MGVRKMKSLKNLSLKNYTYEYVPSKEQHDKEKFNYAYYMYILPDDETNPLKLYSFDNNLVLYVDDGYFYYYDEMGFLHKWAQKFYYEMPKSVCVKKDGENSFLAIYNGEGFFPKDNINFTLPVGENYEFFKDRLIVTSNKTIYISKRCPFDDGDENVEAIDCIKTENGSGKIVGVAKYNDFLLVFTEHHFYKLKIIDDEQISFNKLELGAISILDQSTKKIGDYVYFLSGNYLFKTDGEKLERLTSILTYTAEYLECFAVGDCYAFNTQYENYYVIDTSNLNAFEVNDIKLLTDDGYSYGLSGGERSFIKAYSKNFATMYSDISLNFDKAKLKTLLELEIIAKQKGKIVISGDFGKVTYNLIKGLNLTKCNLTSKEFNVNISERPCNLIEKMIFTYRIVGE